MKAIILAAGYGNRMRPLTDNLHKTLLEVGGQTIIDRIIVCLLKNKISEIIVATGYLSDQLESHLLKTYPQINFKFVHNPRFHETNNIYTLSLVMDSINIDDDIILIESDLVCDSMIIRRIINSEHSNVALVDKFRSGMDGTVVAIRDGVITNIIPPHLQNINFDFSDKYKTLNIYKFSKEFCNTTFRKLLSYYAKIIDDNCYYELILGILIYLQRETIHVEIINGEKWSEVDDPNDLCVANYMFAEDKQLEILENAFGGYWNHDILDFCFIRNMYFPNYSMIAELRNNLPRLICNYGSKQDVLNQKLAYLLLCNKERLTVLNGSSQIFPLIKEYFKDKKALIPEPTFGEYPRSFGNHFTYSDSVGIDVKEIEIKAKDCQLVVIVNPNNPTGSWIQTEWIFKFAQKNPDKIVIIDESFIEFSDTISIINFLEKERLDNIIVVKSLSKSLGISGIRLGYIYSSNETFNSFVKESIPIWNLNSVAENFLEIILKHRNSLKHAIALTIKDREDFRKSLENLKFVRHVYPSGANFLLISLFKELIGVNNLTKELLIKHSIYIKDVSRKFNKGNIYLRLAVRLPEENKKLIDSLTELVTEHNSLEAIIKCNTIEGTKIKDA
jgi:histidinol-phosphate/aromatic aminotransferase/cobyric acid decarboxylase-like protein/choline kinase